MQKRAWEPAAPVGLQRAISGELFEWSWIRCSHHIFFSKKYFLFWKKEKSADCHLQVSVKASMQRLALERIPFLRFLSSFLLLQKYLLLLISFCMTYSCCVALAGLKRVNSCFRIQGTGTIGVLWCPYNRSKQAHGTAFPHSSLCP